jgi:hypothetical protein
MSFSVSLISQINPNCYDYIHFVMTAYFSGVITGKKSDILLFLRDVLCICAIPLDLRAWDSFVDAI